MKKITVLLSDDHDVFREGLRLLLQATDDIQVVGEAENGHSAVGETQRLQPDVVLMDIGMPRLNGVEATRRIARRVPSTKVLILSTYSDDQHVQQALEAGAAGYLPKTVSSENLFEAIRDACKGNASFSPPIAGGLLEPRRKPARQPRSVAATALSARQTEVLQLVAEGCTNARMARLLSLSIKTIEKHRQSVMDKLDIHKVATLTRYAISNGMVETNLAGIGGSKAPARWNARKPAAGPNPHAGNTS